MSNKDSSAVIDSLLKLTVSTGLLTLVVVAPNSLQALDKPLKKFFDSMDANQRQRETRRVMRYMKQQGLLKGEYEHGLQITEKGKARLMQSEERQILTVSTPERWDSSWRIVMFDIPEQHKTGRDGFTNSLKIMGFYQLQKSVWAHAYPCREQIETIATRYGIDHYVTYIETSFIDNQTVLLSKFPKCNTVE